MNPDIKARMQQMKDDMTKAIAKEVCGLDIETKEGMDAFFGVVQEAIPSAKRTADGFEIPGILHRIGASP